MKAVALPVIDPARCTGCGWCVAVCPPHVLSLQVQATAARVKVVVALVMQPTAEYL